MSRPRRLLPALLACALLASCTGQAEDTTAAPTTTVVRTTTTTTTPTTTTSTATTVPVKRARIICMIGAKGGLGTSTLAVNIAATMSARKQDVILLELRPGLGIAGALLGINKPSGLSALLQRKPEELTAAVVEKEIVGHPSGLRAVLASAEPHDYAMIVQTARIEAIVTCLASLTQNLIIDLGCGLTEASAKLLMGADHVMILVEPMRHTVTMAKALMTDLETLGLAKSRIEFILVNRERSSLQMARAKVEEIAKLKMVDLDVKDLAAAIKTIEGTARSMGLEVV